MYRGQNGDLQLENSRNMCTTYKYMGVKITKNGSLENVIEERNCLGRIAAIKNVIWDQHISITNEHNI